MRRLQALLVSRICSGRHLLTGRSSSDCATRFGNAFGKTPIRSFMAVRARSRKVLTLWDTTWKTRIYAVQCKRKDLLLHKLLTEDEVLEEVENAKAFEPPLEASSSRRAHRMDARSQALARRITQEHAKTNLFRVYIFGWTEIVQRIGEYREVVERSIQATSLTLQLRLAPSVPKPSMRNWSRVSGASSAKLMSLRRSWPRPTTDPRMRSWIYARSCWRAIRIRRHIGCLKSSEAKSGT